MPTTHPRAVGRLEHRSQPESGSEEVCFGAARKFTEPLLSLQGAPAVVILRMRHVLAMDATRAG